MRLIDADVLINDLEHDIAIDEDILAYVGTDQITRATTQFDKDCKQNAIDLLMSAPTIDIPHGDDWEAYSERLWKNAYERGKADRPQGEWIPCSERLPKENTEVLMSLEWGIDIGECRNGDWHSEWINHYDDGNVLAWMPLPKPWKGADDE